MPPANVLTAKSPCPCGSTKVLAECCLPYIEGALKAPTAETLMRSRYTAHVLPTVDYLWDTWSPEKRVRSSKQEIKNWATSCEWLALKIVETHKGQPEDSEGLVSFIALFKQNGELHEHHEVSIFKKSLAGWCYVDHKDA